MVDGWGKIISRVKKMSKDVQCPMCKKPVQLFDPVFDNELNLLCNHCNSIVFPISEVGDEELRRKFPIDTTSTTGYSYPAKKEPVSIRVFVKDQKTS